MARQSKEVKYRADNTYMISTDSTDNPKLGAKVLSNGRESLFLDFYLGFTLSISSKTGKEYKRVNCKREYLSLYLWHNPNPIQRQDNKTILELAKKIRFERGQQLLESTEGYRTKKERDINFLDYFAEYIEKYPKKDVRMIKLAYNRFKDFLNDTPEYNRFAKRIKPEWIDRDMIIAFTEYLQSRSEGEGASTIYKRFKKVIKYAVEHDVIAKNPCSGVTISVDINILKKDILSKDEIVQLISTHYTGENPIIRSAFIFCLYTGLRFCDVKDLTFANIDYSNKMLRFEQNKTKGHSSASGVDVPLSTDLLELIGNGNRDDLIFNLPSHTMCNKALRHWVARAGIDKHITWHCARHSFGTNILNNGANIKTLASLMGHSSLQHTEKYVRAVDSLKRDAVEKLTSTIKLS